MNAYLRTAMTHQHTQWKMLAAALHEMEILAKSLNDEDTGSVTRLNVVMLNENRMLANKME